MVLWQTPETSKMAFKNNSSNIKMGFLNSEFFKQKDFHRSNFKLN
jgi:hypothetical protein